MHLQTILYHMMIYIYALSLLFYFSDVVDASGRAKRTGTGLLIFVWIMQTGLLVQRMIMDMSANVVTLFDYLFFVSWLLVTVSLVMSRFFRIEFLVFFVNVFGFAIVTLNLFSRPDAQIQLATWALVRELLYVHISLIACAYVVLAIGAIFSAMYLFLHQQLKRKHWSKPMRRLPSLESIDRYAFRCVLIGTPLLILSLAVAITSILVEGRALLLLDWKVFTTMIGVGVYVAYLLRRTLLLQTGRPTAIWNLIAFSVLVVNLFLNSLSRFHDWS
ncbi:cytochrome c biogenesis protein CcsA [Paenibacillus sp. IB182496]|uniref:Cytochrome c biogenesis protein CcsA n=1 Tax=Paenibacillus sabuli TaxID=2772509 RepID=A0A927BQ18_9BACL|nr:cytochrome c biogenesis protein CcsA [Paenibacillus sabuli]MBD2844633.1 cytochrome c biogenesis protein CcsA [Paenibacillus sabuli]